MNAKQRRKKARWFDRVRAVLQQRWNVRDKIHQAHAERRERCQVEMFEAVGRYLLENPEQKNLGQRIPIVLEI